MFLALWNVVGSSSLQSLAVEPGQHSISFSIKSLNLNVLIIISQYTRGDGSLIYKYFNDENFAGRAEFTFEFVDAQKAFGSDDNSKCVLILYGYDENR